MNHPSAPLICKRIPRALVVNGDLSKPEWQGAVQSGRFVDMATGSPALLDTKAALLAGPTHLSVGFWVQEPYPSAKLTERDSLIFQENDVEVFIDGGDCYYEFEMNALNTVYEVFFIWKDAYRRGSRFDIPEFDVLERDAATFGGNFDRDEKTFWRGTHPRGLRWAFLDWDMPGLESAVQILGHLNDPSQPSQGWTAEIAFPWASMTTLAGGRSLPPQPGDEWRIFLGRFQKLAVGGSEVQAAWCCTPHGVYDTHMPDKFTRVVFE